MAAETLGGALNMCVYGCVYRYGACNVWVVESLTSTRIDGVQVAGDLPCCTHLIEEPFEHLGGLDGERARDTNRLLKNHWKTETIDDVSCNHNSLSLSLEVQLLWSIP